LGANRYAVVVETCREGEVMLCIKGLNKDIRRRLFSEVKLLISEQSVDICI